MRYSEFKPSDRIFERAAELWARMLLAPKFDNGDNSLHGAMVETLADAEFTAKVERFRTILADRLKLFRDHDGEAIPETDRVFNMWGEPQKTYTQELSLDVDYDPDVLLAWAAREAGFERTDKTLFPWKTRMAFYGEWVSLSAGYAAPGVYHYPLSGNRWLICQLRGEDMPKIIEAVESGTLTGFEIELAQ